jgi:hypothetical protein
MAINKLDLEFEDDDEIKAREEAERRKHEVEDVDLEFGTEGPTPVKKPARRPPPREGAPPRRGGTPPRRQQADEGEAQSSAPRRSAAPASGGGGPVYIGDEYRLGDELKKVSVDNEVLAIEIEARVKIEVAQKITEIVANNTANAKLLEHKINRILTQMNQKFPTAKKELMMIKKQLAEHVQDTAKSRENEEVFEGKQAPKKKAA